MGAHSGFVFHSDIQQVYQWLNNLPIGMAPRIYMDVANEDRPEIAESAAFLEELLTQYDIPHEWHMFVGEHEEAYWQSARGRLFALVYQGVEIKQYWKIHTAGWIIL